MNEQRSPLRSEPERQDLYEILQVSPRADPAVIEAAYRVLARRYHPDRSRVPDATSRMARLNAAWELLRDPDRRAAYDHERLQPTLHAAAAHAPGSPTEEITFAAAASSRQPAAATAGTAAPRLLAEPSWLNFGNLRRGGRGTLAVGISTQPAGIRVEAGVATGSPWLGVRPALLKGLATEHVTVDVQTHDLAPGRHRGDIELTTSWERLLLPVEVTVRPAALPYRMLAGLRQGRRSTALLFVSVLVLLAIVAALVTVALAR